VLALISLHRNDIRRAREAADAAIGQYSGTATTRFRSQWALWARALILEADGSTAEAYATLAGCWDRCAELGLVLEYRMIGPDLVRMALARADQGRAREVTARVTDLAEQNPGIGSLGGTALRCRGLLDDDAGALRAAADAYADGARPLELALAAEEAGRPWPGAACPGRPGRCSTGRPRSTSGSAPPATWPGPRRCCAGRVSAAAAGAAAADRNSAGPASPPPSARSPAWWPRGCRIPRSATGCTFRTGRCRRTSPTYSPSSTSPPAPSWPPRPPGGAAG
jgi:hypothetical protein